MTTARKPRKSRKPVERSMFFEYWTGATLISLMFSVVLSLDGNNGFEHFWLFVVGFFVSMFFAAKLYIIGWIICKVLFFIAIILPNYIDKVTGNYPGRPKK